MLRYAPGGEYRCHYDAGRSLPTVLSILYYLSGSRATWFPFADVDSGLPFGSREAMAALLSGLDPSMLSGLMGGGGGGGGGAGGGRRR